MRAGHSGTSILGIPTKAGHWYLGFGLIDLGSPEWPGAGTVDPWWIPDRIGPYDMSRNYVRHDEIFDPARQSMAERLGFEIDAFAHALRPDLVKLFLQVIYQGRRPRLARRCSRNARPDNPARGAPPGASHGRTQGERI